MSGGDTQEVRSLALTPTWSVASVLTIFVAVSLLVERSIHRLSNVSKVLFWFPFFYSILRRGSRKQPLYLCEWGSSKVCLYFTILRLIVVVVCLDYIVLLVLLEELSRGSIGNNISNSKLRVRFTLPWSICGILLDMLLLVYLEECYRVRWQRQDFFTKEFIV